MKMQTPTPSPPQGLHGNTPSSRSAGSTGAGPAVQESLASVVPPASSAGVPGDRPTNKAGTRVATLPAKALTSWSDVSALHEFLETQVVHASGANTPDAAGPDCVVRAANNEAESGGNYPVFDPLALVKCTECGRRVRIQNFVNHAESCTGRSPSPEPGRREPDDRSNSAGRLDGLNSGPNLAFDELSPPRPIATMPAGSRASPSSVIHINRPTPERANGASTIQMEDSDKTKRKNKKKQPSNKKNEIKVLDLDRMCAVVVEGTEHRPCMRSLSCKAHSIKLKRIVPGRSRTFDELLALMAQGTGTGVVQNGQSALASGGSAASGESQGVKHSATPTLLPTEKPNLPTISIQIPAPKKRKVTPPASVPSTAATSAAAAASAVANPSSGSAAASRMKRKRVKQKRTFTFVKNELPQPLAVCNYGASSVHGGRAFAWDGHYKLVGSVIALRTKSKAAALSERAPVLPVGLHPPANSSDQSASRTATTSPAVAEDVNFDFYLPPFRTPIELFKPIAQSDQGARGVLNPSSAAATEDQDGARGARSTDSKVPNARKNSISKAKTGTTRKGSTTDGNTSKATKRKGSIGTPPKGMGAGTNANGTAVNGAKLGGNPKAAGAPKPKRQRKKAPAATQVKAHAQALAHGATANAEGQMNGMTPQQVTHSSMLAAHQQQQGLMPQLQHSAQHQQMYQTPQAGQQHQIPASSASMMPSTSVAAAYSAQSGNHAQGQYTSAQQQQQQHKLQQQRTSQQEQMRMQLLAQQQQQQQQQHQAQAQPQYQARQHGTHDMQWQTQAQAQAPAQAAHMQMQMQMQTRS